ncbi:MAG: gamma-glutamylcyclotransferase [Pseudomonadota bacterium]
MASQIPGADRRLATYGTLVPGQVNAHQLDGLSGRWLVGSVRGHLVEEGWGAAHGCPGIRIDRAGEEVAVHVFESPDLPLHWVRLDAFEGESYRRVSVMVETAEGTLAASIYEIAL